MSRRMTILLFAVVAAQVIGLVVFASVRQVAVTQGREVTLQTVPVDPRSLLQGDYAILDYEMPSFLTIGTGLKSATQLTLCSDPVRMYGAPITTCF